MAKRPEESVSRPVIAAVTKAFGPPTRVFPERASGIVGIDVHAVGPGAGRPYYTLFTTGMSGRPMAGDGPLRFAELLLKLPPDWPFADDTDGLDDAWRWPVRWLKAIARRPLGTGRALGDGDLVANGEPAAPLVDGCTLSAWLLEVEGTLAPIERADGGRVTMLALRGISREELRFARSKGVAALQARLGAKGVGDVLDPRRRSTVRRRFLGLF